MSQHTRQTVPTPALVIDAAKVEQNLKHMADYASAHSLKLRPHIKTHKSKRMALRQLAHGATGLTVAKVGEAEVMSEICDDLLIAYPALTPDRVTRIAALAQRITVRVAVDSTLAIDAIAAAARKVGSTVGILPDLDGGVQRTGVQTPQEALALAQHVTSTDGVRLDGLFTYAGHIVAETDDAPAKFAAMQQLITETLNLWRENNLEAPIVSAGSTPSARQSHLAPAVTEIRPGTYIYHDRNCVAFGVCGFDQCASRVVATVISNAVPGKVVVDAGSKALTQDICAGGRELGCGYVPAYPEAKVVRLSEEHGEIDISRCKTKPALGDRIEIIPNHTCVVSNLFDSAWLADEKGNCEPLPIDARGMLS